MVLILDGSKDHMVRTYGKIQAFIQIQFFFFKRPILLYKSATCSELPCYISTMHFPGRQTTALFMNLPGPK